MTLDLMYSYSFLMREKMPGSGFAGTGQSAADFINQKFVYGPPGLGSAVGA